MDIKKEILSIFFFVIIAGQNYYDIAVQAKLDEIISALPKARDELEDEDVKVIQNLRRD